MQLADEEIQAIRQQAAQAALQHPHPSNPYPADSQEGKIWSRHFQLALNARYE